MLGPGQHQTKGLTLVLMRVRDEHILAPATAELRDVGSCPGPPKVGPMLLPR